MSDTLIVTGASGYVGRNIVREFIRRGVPVRGLVRSEASAELVRGLGAEPLRGDIMDHASLEAAMQGAALLVHAAADTDHGRPTEAQMRTNIQGTRNVYEAARAVGIRRAVHISTEAVLMDGRPIEHADETWPIPGQGCGRLFAQQGGR